MRQILFLSLIFGLSIVSDSEARVKMPSTGLDAIYGQDDRVLISNKSESTIKKIAASVAMVVSVDVLDIGMFKTTIKASSLQETMNMCVSEHFVARPSLPACTAFLVAPNIMATAGHCFVNEDDCTSKKIIFDVDASKQSRKGYSVSTKDVYSCKSIISSEMMDMKDFALIELDRAPKKRVPLKLNLDKKIEDKASVFMIGHPFGLPLTLSRNATVLNNSDTFQFTASLDSFEGNSGSPVINKETLLVEGILVNGQQDLVQDSKLGCYRNVIYSGSGGEGAFRVSELPPL